MGVARCSFCGFCKWLILGWLEQDVQGAHWFCTGPGGEGGKVVAGGMGKFRPAIFDGGNGRRMSRRGAAWFSPEWPGMRRLLENGGGGRKVPGKMARGASACRRPVGPACEDTGSSRATGTPLSRITTVSPAFTRPLSALRPFLASVIVVVFIWPF